MEAIAGTLEEAAVEAGRHVGNAWTLTGILRAMPHFFTAKQGDASRRPDRRTLH